MGRNVGDGENGDAVRQTQWQIGLAFSRGSFDSSVGFRASRLLLTVAAHCPPCRSLNVHSGRYPQFCSARARFATPATRPHWTARSPVAKWTVPIRRK